MKKIIKRTLYPNAKLNIYLELISQRKDGYHLLETVMLPISLFDEIDITLYDKGDISVKTLNSPIPQNENIVYKVIKKVQKEFNIDFGADITIKKNIPTGAGLGGGSSDGAFVLNFLNKIFSFADLDTLIKFSSEIGADIPFFLINKPAFCEGIGEIITEINFPEKDFYLFIPKYHVNTAKIFQNRKKHIDKDKLFGNPLHKHKNNIIDYLSKNNLLYFNRLEESVKSIEPNLFKKTEKINADLHLTGTGSCFYSDKYFENSIKVKVL